MVRGNMTYEQRVAPNPSVEATRNRAGSARLNTQRPEVSGLAAV